jgi:cyclohexanone monooxygenase
VVFLRTGDSDRAEIDREARFDAIVVGAGFGGLYMLHRLRGLGLEVRVYEQADDVGGTWYWNRYPGARCDAESLAYSFSFSSELEQEWEWKERYATQPQILEYVRHVADRFELRSDIRFERRVAAARYDDEQRRWHVETEQGDSASAAFLVMATGCLSVPLVPDIPGLEDFSGTRYQTAEWPHSKVDFHGQRVGIIGTGSSAIQAIPEIAEEAEQLTVFQRTPNFSVPAANAPLDSEWVSGFKKHYPEHRDLYRLGNASGFGDLEIEPRVVAPVAETLDQLSGAALQAALEERWQKGGAYFLATVADTVVSPKTNEVVAEFVRDKIRAVVTDAETAEALCPTSHPIGTKRICVDSHYYKTYNRPNVSLVDLTRTPIDHITSSGVKTSERDYEFDVLILATGFDAMTGAMLKMDVRGVDGVSLREKWAAGPRSYLGIGISGFPNLFTITGPGSPSVLSNMLVSIEQHVDWMIACIQYMQERGWTRIEAEENAEGAWVAHVNEVADATLFPKGGSWYLGANVPGKPRIFMPYAAGVGIYRQVCDGVTAKDYEGFAFA